MFRRLLAPVLVGSLVLAACGSSGTSGTAFNDADVMFAQMMVPHHEQAVEMADIALDPAVGAGTAVTGLATQIKAAQDPEIAQMKGLLGQWGRPLSPDDGMDHGSMMSGMLSPEQLDSLSTQRGPAFDAAWAAAMIAHHEGAIDMANDVLKDGTHPDVRELAGAIVTAQTAEIETLRPLAGK